MHGALSAAGGQVRIGWQHDGAEFTIEWRESGGPPVTAPERLGFGSTLINDIPCRVFGGTAQLDYAAQGVVWRLAAPLAMVRAGVRG